MSGPFIKKEIKGMKTIQQLAKKKARNRKLNKIQKASRKANRR